MSTHPSRPGSPIYDQLVEEHGDVIKEARRLAELTHRQADRVLRWDTPSLGFAEWEDAERT
ncbi:hypothetical protein AB0A69_32875 [Streptomyces sp. NPDC045431]|uniref:hypothetical protein n=1 Tax=Streptomyces sp. NPDC045431 TaxID=3155613 RepID=UPI0033C8412C